MGRKVLYVSPEALVWLFRQDGTQAIRFEGMPEDARIVGVSHHLRFLHGQYAFMVESASFPEISPGCAADELDLRVSCKRDELPRDQSFTPRLDRAPTQFEPGAVVDSATSRAKATPGE